MALSSRDENVRNPLSTIYLSFFKRWAGPCVVEPHGVSLPLTWILCCFRIFGLSVVLAMFLVRFRVLFFHPENMKKTPKITKKLPQMDSKSTLRRPSEPLGHPFGYKPYLKTLLDLIFDHFGSIWGSLVGPFRKPLGLLFLSCTLQEPKIDEI